MPVSSTDLSQDKNPTETQEWREALDSLLQYNDTSRARFIVQKMLDHASSRGIDLSFAVEDSYTNTLPENADIVPEGMDLVDKIIHHNIWNVIAMVMKANNIASELGGHIGSYASSSYLFEVGLNYFLKGRDHADGGDLIYFQGHSAEGIYSRAFFEGRLNQDNLDALRQEAFKDGLSSYPHPWLMPDFWEFPSVSLGLSPLMSIYKAQFLKYMQDRGLSKTAKRNVWMFCGDGEMDETDSLGALKIASRYNLDNLTFVISCNLQRLDGLVYSSGQVVQELSGIFAGSGWNVIKVAWGSAWDDLFAKDTTGILLQHLNQLIDGEYQNLCSKGGAYMRENFFGKAPELLDLVSDLSDEDIENLLPGGHDIQKLFTAYSAAVQHKGQPTVILAHTIKGYELGKDAASRNVAHNVKDISLEARKNFCKKHNLSLTDDQIDKLDYVDLSAEKEALDFLMQQRKNLGGFLPHRQVSSNALAIPELDMFEKILEGSGDREQSTTMVLNRIFGVLLKDKALKERIVPIFSDEARTFGMEGLFRQLAIYNPLGQIYEPEDKQQLVYYKESKTGQVFQQGITESGCMASWIACGSSYQTTNVPMIPFFIYYSMFGYQRVGDLVWAAGDNRARGFIVGGTAGRTTLAGEGLQHQDGHNYLMFSMVPNCISYDPTFGYEMAVIVHYGLQRMYQDQDDVFFYITAMNENYVQPAMPEGVAEGIIEGMYLFRAGDPKDAEQTVQLLGSGAILREVIAAADILQDQFNIDSDIWSVTSFNELRKNIESVDRHKRLHPADKSAQTSIVARNFADKKGPFIAATDYIKLNAEQVRSAIPGTYTVLGTDGFGRSDTREQLRDHFEVNANMIAYTALCSLVEDGLYDVDQLQKAQSILNIDTTRPDPISH